MDPNHVSTIFMDDGMVDLLIRVRVTLNVPLCARVSITLMWTMSLQIINLERQSEKARKYPGSQLRSSGALLLCYLSYG